MADRVVAYAAGDHRIVFPAAVALQSLEDHNPGQYHRIICFDGSDLTEEHRRIMDHHGIEFLDARTVPDFTRVKEMPLMQEGRWPAEVFLNWALPEHLATLGWRYSLKFDYDVVCVDAVEAVDKAIEAGTAVAYRRLGPRYQAPSAEIAAAFEEKTGRPFPTSNKINVGVAFFDNQAMQEGNYFDNFLKAYGALMEISPQMNATEQIALAAVSHDFGKSFRPLPASMNRFARPFKSKFEPEADIRIIHYNGNLKPWKPIEDRHYRMAERHAEISPLLLREMWLQHAQRVRGFEDYTDQRPIQPLELLSLVKTLESSAEGENDE